MFKRRKKHELIKFIDHCCDQLKLDLLDEKLFPGIGKIYGLEELVKNLDELMEDRLEDEAYDFHFEGEEQVSVVIAGKDNPRLRREMTERLPKIKDLKEEYQLTHTLITAKINLIPVSTFLGFSKENYPNVLFCHQNKRTGLYQEWTFLTQREALIESPFKKEYSYQEMVKDVYWKNLFLIETENEFNLERTILPIAIEKLKDYYC